MKYVVRFDDGTYYRDRNRMPRSFLHNATKMTHKRAVEVATEKGGQVIAADDSPQQVGN